MAEVPDDALVEASDVTFGYGGRAVVWIERFALCRASCLGVFGPNGSGKTTLVRGATGLLSPLRGQMYRQSGLHFGLLSQYRGIDSRWPMSGFDAAAMASSASARWGRVGRDLQSRVHAAMRRLDVFDLAPRSFAILSGGQQQRLLLAGALAAEPDVLVLDEPTDGLDVRSRMTFLQTLTELVREGLSVVLISHDIEELLAVCSNVAWLHTANEVGQASRVELVPPGILAERVVAHALPKQSRGLP